MWSPIKMPHDIFLRGPQTEKVWTALTKAALDFLNWLFTSEAKRMVVRRG